MYERGCCIGDRIDVQHCVAVTATDATRAIDDDLENSPCANK